MPVLRYENLTHLELSALPRDRTVVFLSVGPLEQHGPHLPLGTDALSAAFFAESIAEKLHQKRADWTFILFPTIFAGSDTLTYTGSIEVRPRILRSLLLENCNQLARDGFRNIVAFGTHGGPRHMVVLEEVSTRMRWRRRARMVSASARVLFDYLHGDLAPKIVARMAASAQPMTTEEQQALKNDFHGGLIETSIMLVAKPQLVNPIYKTLRPALVESFWNLRRSSGKKVGEGLGHLGSPALARPEIGQAAIDVLIDEVSPSLERFLNGENVDKEFRSKLYLIPFFRTDFSTVVLVFLYPLVLLGIWYGMSTALLKMIR